MTGGVRSIQTPGSPRPKENPGARVRLRGPACMSPGKALPLVLLPPVPLARCFQSTSTPRRPIAFFPRCPFPFLCSPDSVSIHDPQPKPR